MFQGETHELYLGRFGYAGSGCRVSQSAAIAGSRVPAARLNYSVLSSRIERPDSALSALHGAVGTDTPDDHGDLRDLCSCGAACAPGRRAAFGPPGTAAGTPYGGPRAGCNDDVVWNCDEPDWTSASARSAGPDDRCRNRCRRRGND